MTDVNKDLVRIDYLQGMSYKDLGEKHNVKTNTIKAWVKRYGWAKDKAKIERKVVLPINVPLKNKQACTPSIHKDNKGIKEKKEGIQDKKRVQKKDTAIDEYEPIPYIENKDLNDKQKLFCIYYIKCFNATKAYLKAYDCDYISAVSNGSRLLTNDNIRAEIEHLKADKFKGAMLSPMDILQKYIDIAFSDITDYADFGNAEYKTKNEDGKEEIRTYSFVNFKNSNEVDGTIISEIKQGKDGISLKLESKKWALDFLAKHIGLLDIPTQEKLKNEQKKMEIAEKQADNLDDDIEYTVEGSMNEDYEEG
jgi:phage terminase small subunit